ncbi:MAG: hypothetical protein ABI601_10130 [bacterium]
MSCFAARHALSLILFSVSTFSACVDRPSSAAASNHEVAVTGDAGSSTRVVPGPAGVIAVTAESAAKVKETVGAPPPKRSRRDSVALASMTKPDSILDGRWPVKMPPPLAGALLPANRILAFYGNPLSTKMGVLGEYPKDQMLTMLDREVARWAKADPEHPVIPALHFIVTVAQGAPGRNGLYRLQMRDSMVNAMHEWAKSRHALLFLDVQPGKSTVQAEVPRLRPFLEHADVHLGIDPEFAMAPSGAVPSSRVGTVDAKDINWAIDFLDRLVKEKQLPPKVLIVHRWTRKMVTNAKEIRPTPHVQVVMDMDGWGPPWLKFDSYHDYIKEEPVQFTGFKLFFHHDTRNGDPLLTPEEVLRLTPKPLYIQYQ